MSKIELPTVTGNNNISRINDNFKKIEDALNQEVLYRKGYVGEPNEMDTNLDMNGKEILNVATGTSDGSLVTKSYVDQGLSLKFDKSGGPLSGPVDMQNNQINNLPNATQPSQPATYGQLLQVEAPGDSLLRNELAEVGGAGLITDTLKPVTWSWFAGGADKTGVADSAAALSAVYTGANSDGMGIIIPKGLYRVGNEVRDVGSDTIWLSRDFNSGVSASDTAKKTPLLITVGNPDEPVISSEYTRVGINITARGRGAQHIDCIRASLINYSTDGQGNTAIYASASSVPGALWSAALHGETKHDGGTSIGMSSESASYTTGGTFYGAVLNNTTGTAAETHPTTGAPVVAHPQATALYITGGNTRGEMGQWVRGIRFSPLSMRANGTLIRDESSCSQGYWSLPESSKSNADILLEGTAPQGIIIQGTYSSGNAIRLKSGDAVAYEATGLIKTRYSSADVQWGLYNGATQQVGFGTTVYGMYFNGSKVVGVRQTGFARMTGTPLKTSFNADTATLTQVAQRLKAIEDALHADSGHGLYGLT